MYVVGGRVGMNETCYFSLDVKKLDPTLPYTLLKSSRVESTKLYCTLRYATLLSLLFSCYFSLPYSSPFHSTLFYSSLLYYFLSF